MHQVVIHKLIKAKHGKAAVEEGKAALTITGPVSKLVVDIHELYSGKASKGYGRFEKDELAFPLAGVLRKVFIDGDVGFFEASKSILRILAGKANDVPLSTGGYVMMAHVGNEASVSWFIVAIINNVDGTVIDDETLEVVDAAHVDLTSLRVAGRVNLTDWLSGDEEVRYIGFLKQRGEVADYFKSFLGCNDLIVNSVETKKMVQVLKSFARDKSMQDQEATDFLQSAYDFCLTKTKSDTALSLDALSNAIWPEEPKELLDAFVAGDVQISDGFVPDGRSMKALVRMKYKTDYWSIDLDRHAITEGYAQYIPSKGELVLRNLPAGLKEELDREIQDDTE